MKKRLDNEEIIFFSHLCRIYGNKNLYYFLTIIKNCLRFCGNSILLILTHITMKKIVLFFALASTVAFTSCSKDEDDTDAIVGTWVYEVSATPQGGETTTREDIWLFKADHSGEFKKTTNGEIDAETSFSWTKSDEGYQVDYKEAVRSNEVFTIGELLGKRILEKGGTMVATKK
ncbi:hypothetical protein B4Q04_03480 [Zobellia sp. OII3]|nr:hypothetical protein B4Q04_03480 [Zobellia sp. OII3]